MTEAGVYEQPVEIHSLPDRNPLEKEELKLGWEDYKWPLFFLLCASAIGLYFPLGYLLMPIILINRFRNNRYDFVIMVTILCGGYGLTQTENFVVNLSYITYVISIIGILIFKKTLLMRKIVTAWVCYAVILLLFALKSEETLMIQVRRLLPYQSLIYFLVPMMCFAGQKFDIREFFFRVMPYCLLICVWYILDGLIFGSWIFLPRTYIWGEAESTFFDPIIAPFTFPRKYPPGLYLLTLGLFPLVKYYTLSWKKWVIIVLALFASRTFTIILGLIVVYLFLQGKIKRFLKYFSIAFIIVGLFYGVDFYLSGGEEGEGGSVLRVKSSIDQIIGIGNIQDEEDLAKLGTGRVAQAIPKLELLYDLGMEWTGFGFLDEDRTTMTKYMIFNELYLTSDITKREEVATGVEIMVVQHILNIGYLGLLVVLAFYGYFCFLIRHLKYRMFVYSVLLSFVIFGIAGFSGLIYVPGLYLIALSLAAALLADKHSDKETEAA